MKKEMRWIALVLAILFALATFTLAACDKNDVTIGGADTINQGKTSDTKNDDEATDASEPPAVPTDAPNPVVTITMEDGSEIVLELYRDKAPNTVDNFISLAQDGFYDGLTFHRVSEGFMIQGGCPRGDGRGDPGYSIKGEFSENGFADNDISHLPGVISMARSDDPDSAGSQFFICAGDASFLDGKYAAFGKVTAGLKTVYAIAKLNTEPNGGPPSTPQIMKSVTVDTFGVEYPKPETIAAR